MPKFRKKPVVIEAFQMTPEHRAANEHWPSWMHEAWNKPQSEPGALFCRDFPNSDGTDPLRIMTLEGVHDVTWGDFIIRGVKGELYPCKPDIFAATYEPAEELHMQAEPAGYNPGFEGGFGWALARLKDGFRIARHGWNGVGMFAYLVPAASYPAQTGAAKEHFGDGAMVPYRAYLALKTAQGDVANWVPSCSDVLADDWAIVI